MSRSRGRPLNVLDGMILVAATAIGLALVEPYGWSNLAGASLRYDPELGSWRCLNGFKLSITPALLPVWSAWTFAVLAVRVRGPRPPYRRLAGQPGLIACLTASVLISALVAACLVGMMLAPRQTGLVQDAMMATEPLVPGAVLGAWVATVAGRRCRAEPGPIDRIGIILGVGWISLLLPDLAWLCSSHD